MIGGQSTGRRTGLAVVDADNEVISSINTTPLVDVMLVLLIIFLITVPVVTASVPVNLPDERTQARQVPPRTLTVSVDRSGRLYLGDVEMRSPDELAKHLKARAEDDVAVHLLGDADTPYVKVEAAVRAIRQAGVTRVGFLTEPREP